MSIREIGEKIKTLLKDDRTYVALALVLVALISFGIGRLSVTVTSRVGQEATAIQKIDTRPSKEVAAPSQENSTSTNPSSSESANKSSSDGMYVGSKNSTKYHLPWCSGAKRIADANKIWFASKEEAEKAGYTPAGNCPGL